MYFKCFQGAPRKTSDILEGLRCFFYKDLNILMMSPCLSDPSVFLASCVKWNIMLVKVSFQLMEAVWNQSTESALKMQ